MANSNNPIGLVDCNNFFASCERVVNPSLKDRPVVVLSHNDGCIISRSDEVKKLGVQMATPLFQVRDLLEKNNTAIISSNHALYCDFSNRVMEILYDDIGRKAVEVYSIDEAFLNVGAPDKLKALGTHIRERISKETGIPVSVGIAETKTLAKLANRIAKKSAKTGGVLDLYRSPHIDLALQKTDVGSIWGVGPKSAEKLKEIDIKTAFDLKMSEPEQIKNYLTVFGARTVLELRGINCLPLEFVYHDKKSIAYTRSFGHTIESFNDLKDAVMYFTTRALEKMRHDRLAAKSIAVFLKTDRFNPKPHYVSETATFNSVYYSDVTCEITKWAVRCLERIYRENLGYRKAGIILSNLTSIEAISKRLYEQSKFERLHHLNKLIDEMNFRFGRDTLRFASLTSRGMWQGHSAYLSNDANHPVPRDGSAPGMKLVNFRRFV